MRTAILAVFARLTPAPLANPASDNQKTYDYFLAGSEVEYTPMSYDVVSWRDTIYEAGRHLGHPSNRHLSDHFPVFFDVDIGRGAKAST